MKRFLILSAALSAFSFFAASETLTLTPGSLKDRLPGISISGSQLKIAGKADIRDLDLLSDLPEAITDLDLSDLSIVEYVSHTPDENGRTYASAGHLPKYCFFSGKISKLTLPAKIVAIPEGAFAGSEITEIVIPEGVTSIGDYAFYNCASLRKVSFPRSLVKIGQEAFGKCSSLSQANLSMTKVAEIPARCFSLCGNLESISLPASVKSIGTAAFSGSAISALSLSGVTNLADYALSGMPNLSKVNLNPDAYFGKGVLMDDLALTELEGIPDNVPDLFAANCPEIGYEMTLDNSAVGKYSFANTGFTSLVLTPTLSYLDAGAFANLSGLRTIYALEINSSIPEVADEAFSGINPRNVNLMVTDKMYPQWQSHPVWGQFNVIPETPTDVSVVETEVGIKIYVAGNQLRVVSSSEILHLAVYSLAGNLLHASTPGSNEFSLSLDDINESAVVVNAVNKSEEKETAKILLK